MNYFADTNQLKFTIETCKDKKPDGMSLKKDILYYASNSKQKTNLRNVMKKEKNTSVLRNKLTKNKDLISDIYKQSNYDTDTILNFDDTESELSELYLNTIDNNSNEFDSELNNSKPGIEAVARNEEKFNLKETKAKVIPAIPPLRESHSQNIIVGIENKDNTVSETRKKNTKDILSSNIIPGVYKNHVNSVSVTNRYSCVASSTEYRKKFGGDINNTKQECPLNDKIIVSRIARRRRNDVKTNKRSIHQNSSNKNNVLFRNIENDQRGIAKKPKNNDYKTNSSGNPMQKTDIQDNINILFNNRICSGRSKPHLSESINYDNSTFEQFGKKNKTSSTSDKTIKDLTTEVNKLDKSRLQKSQNSVSFPNLTLLNTPKVNKILRDYTRELKNLYEQGNLIIKLQIQVQNGLFSKFSSIITRVPSGTIGIDLQKLKYLGDIPLEKILLEYPVTLIKTVSGTYVVKSQNNGVYNAVLKTISRDKILLVPISPKYPALMFKEVLGKLRDSNTKIYNGHVRESKISLIKAESYSQLYDHIGVKMKVSQNILCQTSFTMNKTVSGHYVLALDKQFTKSLIDNLKSHLSSNMECLVPKNKTEVNKNSLSLPNSLIENENLASLKITTSGNICVILDTETVNGMADLSKNNSEFNVVNVIRSEHLGRPKDYVSDISDYASKELQTDTANLKSDITSEVSSIRDYVTQQKEDVSPHIVIKPTSENCPQKEMTTKECFYVFDTVCSYHKDRYDDISNELLEITGLCNTMQDNSKLVEFKSDIDSDAAIISQVKWDSLNYLPPQLPPFLKNIIR